MVLNQVVCVNTVLKSNVSKALKSPNLGFFVLNQKTKRQQQKKARLELIIKRAPKINMDSNINLTVCIRIPLMGETVFVWKNMLEVESEEPGVWVFYRGQGVR